MAIKLAVLKSGEDVIADIREMMVGDEDTPADQKKVVGYYFIKPCGVTLKNKAIDVNESADDFINSMILNNKKIKKFHLWIKKCSILKKNFNFSKELYKHNDFINPYIFIKKISKYTKDDSVIIMDGGVVMNFVMQALEIRKKQRLISASGLDGEGFSLPASIGLSLIDKSREIICFCEEKSFLNSLNELNTIHRYGCHIKIICLLIRYINDKISIHYIMYKRNVLITDALNIMLPIPIV